MGVVERGKKRHEWSCARYKRHGLERPGSIKVSAEEIHLYNEKKWGKPKIHVILGLFMIYNKNRNKQYQHSMRALNKSHVRSRSYGVKSMLLEVYSLVSL